MKITFIGGGSFGTAMASALVRAGHEALIFVNRKQAKDEINELHENPRYLPKVSLPLALRATTDLEEAINFAEIVVFAVPSASVRSAAKAASDFLKKDQWVVSLAKGVDPETLEPLSQVLQEELKVQPVILSGPSHAEEVALDLPTSLVAASQDEAAMKLVQKTFSSPTLRVYRNDDLIGVEIGAAVKNIIALAAGISDGVGFGDNAKAALMTRGMAEIIRMGTAMGAQKETFYGLTGMGDLIVTCTSMHSRNRRCGILIGQGMSMEEATQSVGMVVEGIKSTKAFHDLARKKGVEMPITFALYEILFEHYPLKTMVDELMTRDLKME